jgi:hypothetical protein
MACVIMSVQVNECALSQMSTSKKTSENEKPHGKTQKSGKSSLQKSQAC